MSRVAWLGQGAPALSGTLNFFTQKVTFRQTATLENKKIADGLPLGLGVSTLWLPAMVGVQRVEDKLGSKGV